TAVHCGSRPPSLPRIDLTSGRCWRRGAPGVCHHGWILPARPRSDLTSGHRWPRGASCVCHHGRIHARPRSDLTPGERWLRGAPLVCYFDSRPVRTLLLHQVEEHCGMMRMQPYASMRCGSPKSIDRVAAVDRVAIVEEDRKWHRRVVVRGGEPVALQSLR